MPNLIEPIIVNFHPCASGGCHGGTYITSDNFPAQKISFKNGVTIFTGSTPVQGNQAGISCLVGTFFLLLTSFFPLPSHRI